MSTKRKEEDEKKINPPLLTGVSQNPLLKVTNEIQEVFFDVVFVSLTSGVKEGLNVVRSGV